MKKDRFLLLVQNYTSLSEEEAIELDSLQRDYPFSQIIHHLATRAAQDNQLPTHKQLLSVSAVYSTDRSVLKELMTEPKSERKTVIPPDEPVVIEAEKPTHKEDQVVYEPLLMPTVAHSSSTLSGDSLISEIKSDLSRLKELRHHFELSLQEFENAHAHPTPLAESKKPAKKSKIIDEDDHLDELIEEIRNKKEVDSDSHRQKEQFHIIDQFIRKSPAISRGKAAGTPEDAEDLAEKSSAFGDHIISETLVDILLKQGKTDKAIEVLRKLIWKFPQKKAIFAAQIENLRK